MVKMGNVWDRTAEFLSDELGTVMPIVLLAFFVPSSIISNLWTLLPRAGIALYWGISAVMLLLALLSFWGQLALIALALEPGLGRRAGQVALRRLPAGILVGIACIVLVLALILPIPIALALHGVDMAQIQAGGQPVLPPGVALVLGIYMLALLPLLLWLYTRLVVVAPVIVDEHRALGAIRRSFALTRGAALKIFGVLLLYCILAWVAQFAATFVFGSIFRLVAGGDGDVSLASVLTAIVVAAVQTGFTVLGTAFTAKLYLALVVSRQAAVIV